MSGRWYNSHLPTPYGSWVYKVYRTYRQAGLAYEFLIVDTRPLNDQWGTEMFPERYVPITNESKQVYGMVHVGPHVQFYKWNFNETNSWELLGGTYLIVDNADMIMDWLKRMKGNPFPVM